MSRFVAIAVGVAITCLTLTTSAQALNTRTWISGVGIDQAGCGPIANPCRTLQYAHDNTSAGGEIDVKDSAGYGSVTISKAISIVGDGSISGVLGTASADAIVINAGAADTIVLRGLTIEGAGVATNGVVFNSGGKLDITNCVVQNFTSSGIRLQPASGSPVFVISNTTASHNSQIGLWYYPPSQSTAAGTITIDHVTATDHPNGSGISLANANSSGILKAFVSNSLAANNNIGGIFINNATVMIDLCAAVSNGIGFNIYSGSVTIGRSTASNNGTGLSNGGTTLSFRNNQFSGNTTATSGTIGTATLN